MIEFFKSCKDWIRRNWFMTLVGFVAIWFIGFERELLKTIVTCIAVGCVVVIFSGIANYAYTEINFVKKGDTHALSYIFFGTCVLFGLVFFGYYFAQLS